MEDIVNIEGKFYILATSPLADQHTRVLKHEHTFAVFDGYGDIHPIGLGEQGLYHRGTRFLSRLEFILGNSRPLMLSSTVREDNTVLAIDLTNPDMNMDDQAVPRGTLHILRTKFLWEGACYETIKIQNYGLEPLELDFSINFASDFADIFEVRGLKRERRGRRLEDELDEGRIVLPYYGLDDVRRSTRIEYLATGSIETTNASSGGLGFHAYLTPKEEAYFYLTVACDLSDEEAFEMMSHGDGLKKAKETRVTANANDCQISSSNDLFNKWLDHSREDLHMMLSTTPYGLYPYAGVPWFNTIFGRDGIITALETLCFDPEIARGVLAYLAATQAQKIVPEEDAEPGKILHEVRNSEMARLGEVPFRRYYGSVDATPLFIILANAYYERTGDRSFLQAIWDNITLALDWIDRYGDLDGDGFIEYIKRSPKGLSDQGWKDSYDAIFHADGSLAEGSIALCEVQSYVYAAKRGAANLAHALGLEGKSRALLMEADILKKRFEETFWCDDLSTYAIALDGNNQLCRVRSSNAGHCLFTGIASPEAAEKIADGLVQPDFFSGWGVRTIPTSEARYNPMSYHNGSVWPHDNALIAYGLARYGFKDKVIKVLTGVFESSLLMERHRLPELICGFERRPGEGPTLYPVACSPQSWSAGAVFMLLQACLGLSVNAVERRVYLMHPRLPDFLQEVEIRNLKVGDSSVDLLLERTAQHIGFSILRKEEDVEIVMID